MAYRRSRWSFHCKGEATWHPVCRRPPGWDAVFRARAFDGQGGKGQVERSGGARCAPPADERHQPQAPEGPQRAREGGPEGAGGEGPFCDGPVQSESRKGDARRAGGREPRPLLGRDDPADLQGGVQGVARPDGEGRRAGAAGRAQARSARRGRGHPRAQGRPRPDHHRGSMLGRGRRSDGSRGPRAQASRGGFSARGRVQAAHLALLLPGTRRARSRPARGGGAQARPGDRDRGRGHAHGGPGRESRGRAPDRQPQHGQLRAPEGGRGHRKGRAAQAGLRRDARRVPPGGRVHLRGGERERHPVRARHPHLQPRDALHPGHFGRAAAAPDVPPADYRGREPRGGTARHPAAPRARGPGRRCARRDGRGAPESPGGTLR